MDLKDSLAIKMGLFETYRTEYLRKWDTFEGRVSRIDYWKVFYVNIMVGMIMSLGNIVPILGQIISLPWTLFNLVAGTTFSVRRGHDIGESGWMVVFDYIYGFSSICAAFVLFILLDINNKNPDIGVALLALFLACFSLSSFFHPWYRSLAKGVKGENEYGSDPLEVGENNDNKKVTEKVVERVVYVQAPVAPVAPVYYRTTENQKPKTPKAIEKKKIVTEVVEADEVTAKKIKTPKAKKENKVKAF